MRNPWIGLLLLDPGSATRTTLPSRRAAVLISVRTFSRTINNNLSNINENLQPPEVMQVLAGSVIVEVTL